MSFAQATVTLAKREGPPLDKASVLIVGAGTMAGSVATWFAKAGCAELTIISRRFESAQVLARKHGSRAVPMTDLRMALESADVLVAAVDADEPILEADLIAERRSPLIAIDLGVPRAIASDFGGSPEIKTFDLDSLESIVSDAKSARSGQVQAVEAIIAEETERYLAWQRARQVAPTIAALQAAAEAIRVSELDRIHATMTDLSPAEEAALDSMTRSIVNKLLAQPIIRLKEHAQETHGLAYLDAVRNLFRLDSDSDEMASLDQAQG
jgi:glutamyl-tRNA reductase